MAAFVGQLAARDRAARELVEVSGLGAAGDRERRAATRRDPAVLRTPSRRGGCDIYGVVGEVLVAVERARRGEENAELLGLVYDLEEHPAVAAAIAIIEPLIVADPHDRRLTAAEAQRFRRRLPAW